jgi:hypothetical protein
MNVAAHGRLRREQDSPHVGFWRIYAICEFEKMVQTGNSTSPTIRRRVQWRSERLAPSTKRNGRELWRGYTEFYETHPPENVTAATWWRIVAPQPAIPCRFAEQEGRLPGFSHSPPHEGTFR